MGDESRQGDFSQRDDAAVRAADAAHARQLRDDPATQEWLDKAYRALEDGSFDRDVDSQPDPGLAAEQFKAQRQ